MDYIHHDPSEMLAAAAAAADDDNDAATTTDKADINFERRKRSALETDMNNVTFKRRQRKGKGSAARYHAGRADGSFRTPRSAASDCQPDKPAPEQG